MGKQKQNENRKERKKEIIFLVEGRTDIEILECNIQELYKQYHQENPYKINFCLSEESSTNKIGGDITSKKGVEPGNIEGVINKVFLNSFLDCNSDCYLKNIQEIIHIVDIDGVFIPNSLIEENPDSLYEKTKYYENKIVTNKLKEIEERNERKRNNLKALLEMDYITIRKHNNRNSKKVKYSVYYFSCNMDHCIHGNANLTLREKIAYANHFARTVETTDQFCNIINNPEICCSNMNYKQSWDYIMEEGIHSLERRTNLNILIDRIRNS